MDNEGVRVVDSNENNDVFNGITTDANVITDQKDLGERKDAEFIEEDTMNSRGHWFCRLRSDSTLRHKLLHMACICCTTFSLGWRLSMTGPALSDLRLIIDENLARASWIVSAIAIGGLPGSLLCGALYDRCNKYLLFVGLTLILAGATGATPWCSNFGSMVAIHAVFGVCAAGLNTIIAADVSYLWGKGNAPFMQAINFAFSIGAMFSPLAVAPFLAKQQHILQTVFENNVSLINNSITSLSLSNNTYAQTEQHDETAETNTTYPIGGEYAGTYGETNVHLAYMISGVICLLVSISFVVQYCVVGNVHSIPIQTQSNTDTEEKLPLNRNWRIAFFIVLSLMLSTYVMCEKTTYTYLMTYLTERLGWGKAAGSKATSVFWIMFMTGRLMSIAIVKAVRLLFVLILFLGILALGEVLLLVSVMSVLPALTWVSCGLHGIGLSALFACITSWLSTKVCPLTGKASSILFAMIQIGSAIFPFITGNLMSAATYDWFIYLEMILTFTMIVLLTIAEITFSILT